MTITDWIQAISSASAAVITAVLVWITWTYTKATKAMADQMQRQNRPYVFIDFSMRAGAFDLCISNLGNRAAQDVKFRILDDIANSKGEKLSQVPVIAKGLSYFPPNRSFIFGFDGAVSFLEKKDEDLLLTFAVEYRDGSKTYSDEFKYDVSIYKGMYFKSFSDLGSAIASGFSQLVGEIRSGRWRDDFAKRILKKACPICGETISHSAKKCRHCGEWLKESVAEKVGAEGQKPSSES